MPITPNSKLSSSVANATFVDKTVDDEKKGTLGLFKTANTDPDAIADTQDYINELAEVDGVAGEGDATAKTYSSEQIVANGDDRKVAIGKLDAQVKINLDDIATINSSITGVVTETGTQTLTNKTLTAPIINDAQTDYGTASDTQKLVVPQDTKANLDALTREAGRVYYGTDTELFYFDNGTILLNPAGTLTQLGNIVNLESDPYAQSGVGSWATYDDGAVASPVDMTGGTPGVLFTAQSTETQILSDAYQGAFRLALTAVDNQGEGVAKAFTIPKSFRDKGYLTVSFRMSTDAAVSSGDFGFYAYDVTNAALRTVSNLTSNNLPALSADETVNIQVTVEIPSTCISLRLGFHRKVTTASAVNLFFSDLKVGDSSVQLNETLIASGGPYTITTAAAWENLTSLTLSPGSWDMSFFIVPRNFTGAQIADLSVGIGTANNSNAGMTSGVNRGLTTVNEQFVYYPFSLPSWSTTVTTATTYYLNVNISNNTGGGRIDQYNLKARKMK